MCDKAIEILLKFVAKVKKKKMIQFFSILFWV